MVWPTIKDTVPAAPPRAVPVATIKLPADPLAVVPVLSLMLPEEPAAEDKPVVRVREPVDPEATPEDNIMSPLLPPAATPERITTEPVFPASEVPVLSRMLPLMPVLIAFELLMKM